VDDVRVAVLKRLGMSAALRKDKRFIRAMRQAMKNETTAEELNAVLGSDRPCLTQMSLDWPLGCPPEAHRSRAGCLHQNLPTFCAAPKTPSQ